jgi:hypothetical protein
MPACKTDSQLKMGIKEKERISFTNPLQLFLMQENF